MDFTNLASTKLTKKALMGLDTGLWIASNCFNGAGHPIYAARVAPPEDRESQWAAIREAEANGRGYWIFPGQLELNAWVDDFRRGNSAFVDIRSLLGRGLN